jgi:hypothetical protein
VKEEEKEDVQGIPEGLKVSRLLLKVNQIKANTTRKNHI